MKTIIHVWSHKFNINDEHLKKYNYFNETNFYFGLGDLIRSTIKLFYLAKKMNFNLIVDLQHHPINEYLINKEHEYSNYVKTNENNINYVCYGALEDYINESKENILLILTNDFYFGDIDEECKIFIKNILTPNNKFKKFIDYKISKIPYEEFNIIHYRLNDDEFLNKDNNHSYNNLLEHYNNNKEKNDILISDTKSFKNYIFLNSDCFIFDIKVCHLGLSSDTDEVRDTLFEFFLITQSKKIKSYCIIHKISGFVKWISKIYDISLVKI